MIFWQQFRTAFLAATFIGLVSILGKSIYDPTIGKPTDYNFPAVVPLAGWQPQLASTAPTNKSVEDKQLFSKTKYYRYTKGKNERLDVNMHYVVGTSGNSQLFIKNYTSIPVDSTQLGLVTRYQNKTGFYQLFTYKNQAHLVTCINPQGESTVTSEQFFHNRNLYDLQPKNVLQWLAAQSDLRDRRCLWSHLTVSSDRVSTEDAYRQLETTWLALSQWWSPRFPPL